MRTHTTDIPGLAITTTSSDTGASNVFYSLTIACRDAVVCNPLNKGNHKASTPYSYSIQKWTNGAFRKTSSTDHYILKQWFRSETNSYSPMYNFGDKGANDLAKADFDAYSGLMKDLRGSSTDLAITVLERKQVARMISVRKRVQDHLKRLKRQREKLIRDLIRKTRSRNPAVKAAAQKRIEELQKSPVAAIAEQANSWYLEWVYGWSPICADLYEVTKFIKKGCSTLLRKRGRSQSSTVSKLNETYSTSEGSTIKGDIRTFAKVEYCVTLREPSHWGAQLASLNPASWVWETIPYSFVVDWFFNIGGYLQNFEQFAIQATLGNIVECRKSTIRGQDVSYNHSHLKITDDGATKTTFTRSFSGQQKVLIFNRNVYSNIPYPPAIQFRFELTAAKVAHGLALAVQRMFHLRSKT